MKEKITRIKLWVKYFLSKKTNKYNTYQGKKIIVALAADYGNLGDVAITYAQTKFLKDNFEQYSVIEFPISETFIEIKSLKGSINSEDIITIVGGGNIGDMYDDIEYCRQFIIKQFPNNKIVIFPQTIDFSDSKRGQKAIKRCAKVYNKHKELFLCVREEVSFQRYKNHFKNDLILTPDIVMNLDEEMEQQSRNGVMVAFRSDREAALDYETKKRAVCDIFGEDITCCDTHIGITKKNLTGLYEELKRVLQVFGSHQIVFTDRLHGMIFAYITKTPCIVIPNNNHKIKSCYKWIEEAMYIKLVEPQYFLNSKLLEKHIEDLMSKVRENNLQKVDLSKEFDKIIKIVKGY